MFYFAPPQFCNSLVLSPILAHPKPARRRIHTRTQSCSTSYERSKQFPRRPSHHDGLCNLGSFSPPKSLEDIRDVERKPIADLPESVNDRKDEQEEKSKHVQPVQKLSFKKEEGKAALVKQSTLSELLKPGVMKQRQRRVKNTNITMFICFGEELYKTRVTISETCTASELIAHTLKQYTQETNKIPDPNEPEGYVMSAANPDGTKDLEWPFEINRQSTLNKLGCSHYILHINKKYDKNTSELLKVVENPIQPKREFCFKVYVNGSCHLMPVAPDVITKDLLGLICNRIKLDKSEYVLKIKVNESLAVPVPDHLQRQMVKHVRFREVVLCYANSESCKQAVSPRKNSLDDVITPTFLPMPYREYQVIKINKFGRRQERILGIDDKMIYNTLPKSQQSFLGFLNKTKHPARPCSTISSVQVLDPFSFIITFEDGEICHWVARTQVEASEIVRKFKTLLKMNKLRKQMEQRESRTPRQARLSNCNSPVFGLRKPSVQRALFKTDGDWELVL